MSNRYDNLSHADRLREADKIIRAAIDRGIFDQHALFEIVQKRVWIAHAATVRQMVHRIKRA